MNLCEGLLFGKVLGQVCEYVIYAKSVARMRSFKEMFLKI